MKLHYETIPRLAKNDTLFIHGNLASTAWWQPTARAWTEEGSLGTGALWFADWRGCGKNEPAPPDAAVTIADLARDFTELLDDRNIAHVDLVGHSLGGLIALEMLLHNRERIGRVALLDPVGARGVQFGDEMYEAVRQMGQDRALTRTVILSTIRNGEALDEEIKEQITDDAFKAVRGIGRSVLEVLKTVDLEEQLRGNQTQVLILHGELDQIIPLRDSENLATLLPASRLERLQGVGHCWNLEDPKAFVKRLREWL